MGLHRCIIMTWWDVHRLIVIALSHWLRILVRWRQLVSTHLSLELINIFQGTVVRIGAELCCIIRASRRMPQMNPIRLGQLLIALGDLEVSLVLWWWMTRLKLLLWVVVWLVRFPSFCRRVTKDSAPAWKILISIFSSSRSIRIKFSPYLLLIWWKLPLKVDFAGGASSFAQWKQVSHCGL